MLCPLTNIFSTKMEYLGDCRVSDLTGEENFRLKVIFLVHFVLTTWGIQGYWSPDSYLFYNIFFLGGLIWAIHQNNNGDAMKMAAAINVLAIVLDIIVLCIYYPSGGHRGDIFSATMAVLNLLLRPVSCLWLATTVSKNGYNVPLMGTQPSRYQDVAAPQDYQSPLRPDA